MTICTLLLLYNNYFYRTAAVMSKIPETDTEKVTADILQSNVVAGKDMILVKIKNKNEATCSGIFFTC